MQMQTMLLRNSTSFLSIAMNYHNQKHQKIAGPTCLIAVALGTMCVIVGDFFSGAGLIAGTAKMYPKLKGEFFMYSFNIAAFVLIFLGISFHFVVSCKNRHLLCAFLGGIASVVYILIVKILVFFASLGYYMFSGNSWPAA